MSFDPAASAGRLSRRRPPAFEHIGPVLEVLTDPDSDPTAPSFARGTIPPGCFVGLHSHGDPETFYLLGGALEGITYPAPERPEWQPIGVGEVFHVPPNARHAFRNTGDVAATALVVSTPRLVAFFEQTGRAIDGPDQQLPPPTPGELQDFVLASLDRGYWLGSPAENTAIGLTLPSL